MSFSDDIGTVIDHATSIPEYANMIASILSDPALPEFAQVVSEMRTAEISASGGGPGIGLGGLILPLRLYIFRQNHQVMSWFALAGLLFAPVAFGYALGKRRK